MPRPSSLMSFPAKSRGAKNPAPVVDVTRPLGKVDAWAKENGDIALSAGNYDTTNAYMVVSLDLAAAEQLHKRLGAAILKAKNSS